MSANIDRMFYTGEVPWHGLGTKLDNPATAEEAIKAAGLEWVVERRNLQTAPKQHVITELSPIPIPNHVAIIRTDNNAVLGIATNRYKPVQNIEAFDFFDNVVGGGYAIYHTAGSLGLGERVWILAKLPGHVIIEGTDDVTEKYLLLSNGHDGKTALRMLFTPVRVVCQNTLNVALNGRESEGITIVHTGNLQTKIKEAQRVLGIANKYYEDFAIIANSLNKEIVKDGFIEDYLFNLYPDNMEALNNTRAENIRSTVKDIFFNRVKEMHVEPNRWQLFNAVTEYEDHKSVRGTDQLQRSNRLKSIWFGPRASKKEEAFELALAN